MSDVGRGTTVFPAEVVLVGREGARAIRVGEDPAVGVITEQTQPAAETPAHVRYDLIPVENAAGFVLVDVTLAERSISARGRQRSVDIPGSQQVHGASVCERRSDLDLPGKIALDSDRAQDSVRRSQAGIYRPHSLWDLLRSEIEDGGHAREERRVADDELLLVEAVEPKRLQWERRLYPVVK